MVLFRLFYGEPACAQTAMESGPKSHSASVLAFLSALPAKDFRHPGELVQIQAYMSAAEALTVQHELA